MAEDVWRHYEPDWHTRNDTLLPRLVQMLHLLHCRTVWRTGFKRQAAAAHVIARKCNVPHKISFIDLLVQV